MKPINIDGYEHYLVSKDGKVYNTRSARGVLRNGPRELKSYPNKNTGYYMVVLRAPNIKPKAVYVHRLVAECYIPNSYNKPQINHIDGDKSNNHVSNLEWMTASENSRHALDTGLIIPFSKFRELKSNKKLIKKGLEHYEKYQNVPYLQKLWDITSTKYISDILVENGYPSLSERKYIKIPPFVEEEIKKYLKGVYTKQHKKRMNAPDYIQYIKEKYGIGFSFDVYRKIQLEVKQEINPQ